LAHKLELTDEQVTKLATILAALKTERAQAEVDQRRRVAALADVFEVDVLDLERLQSAGQLQVDTAQRLKASVAQALQQIHAMLDEAQRKEFAYLLRTGVLSI
jgi:ABC-type phosphate transport system auxiliary subunit